MRLVAIPKADPRTDMQECQTENCMLYFEKNAATCLFPPSNKAGRKKRNQDNIDHILILIQPRIPDSEKKKENSIINFDEGIKL